MKFLVTVLLLLAPLPAGSDSFICAIPPADHYRWESMGKPPSLYYGSMRSAVLQSQQRDSYLWRGRCLASKDMLDIAYASVQRSLKGLGVCVAQPRHDDGSYYPALMIRKSEALLEEWKLFDDGGCLRDDPYEKVWWIELYEQTARWRDNG